MDPQLVHTVLEESPEEVAKALALFRRMTRETERVFAVQFLRYKHGGETNYAVDAKQMALASDAYDEAKAKEIKAEAKYKFELEKMVNCRKTAELMAKGI